MVVKKVSMWLMTAPAGSMLRQAHLGAFFTQTPDSPKADREELTLLPICPACRERPQEAFEGFPQAIVSSV